MIDDKPILDAQSGYHQFSLRDAEHELHEVDLGGWKFYWNEIIMRYKGMPTVRSTNTMNRS